MQVDIPYMDGMTHVSSIVREKKHHDSPGSAMDDITGNTFTITNGGQDKYGSFGQNSEPIWLSGLENKWSKIDAGLSFITYLSVGVLIGL